MLRSALNKHASYLTLANVEKSVGFLFNSVLNLAQFDKSPKKLSKGVLGAPLIRRMNEAQQKPVI
jgi:hypothetical protein